MFKLIRLRQSLARSDYNRHKGRRATRAGTPAARTSGTELRSASLSVSGEAGGLGCGGQMTRGSAVGSGAFFGIQAPGHGKSVAVALKTAVLVGFLSAACGPSFQAGTPPGFVELENQTQYDYRATNADGLVIAVREIDHEPKGEIGFWTKAIENH